MDDVVKETLEKFDEEGYKLVKNESDIYDFKNGDKIATVSFDDDLDVKDLEKENYVPFSVGDVDGYYNHEDDGSRTFGYDCNGTTVLIRTNEITLLNHVVLGAWEVFFGEVNSFNLLFYFIIKKRKWKLVIFNNSI